MKSLAIGRVKSLLSSIRKRAILVAGDLMLDQFIWGHVGRISPEAPVPVVEVQQESFMPGGAANVARNLRALDVAVRVCGVVGRDQSGARLVKLLRDQGIDCGGICSTASRMTSIKTRVIAHQQQVVRVDRETSGDIDRGLSRRLLRAIRSEIDGLDAVIVGDYGKGVVSQEWLDELKGLCRERGIWLSLDPKPVHRLDLRGLSLITPNRKEAFELAGMHDGPRHGAPLQDARLLEVSNSLMDQLRPALLLITLGDQGMLLCERGRPLVHIPTAAREIFDVSGAGDTVIASFTMAITAGASPLEAAVFANHMAGVVVGKVGTATASAEELIASFANE